jgi:hypothetical protein
MYEIRADSVPPVHRAGCYSLRIKLVKKVILALVIDHAVRIIHPLTRWTIVELGAIRFVVQTVFLSHCDISDKE